MKPIINKDTELLPGLSLQSREDGVWFVFQIDGKTAATQVVSNYANEHKGTLIGDTIACWLRSYQTQEEDGASESLITIYQKAYELEYLQHPGESMSTLSDFAHRAGLCAVYRARFRAENEQLKNLSSGLADALKQRDEAFRSLSNREQALDEAIGALKGFCKLLEDLHGVTFLTSNYSGYFVWKRAKDAIYRIPMPSDQKSGDQK